MQNVEKDLIAAAQLGNVGAFEQLVHQVEAKMLSVAAGLASNPDEAEDIYQDAMISAFKALPKFRVESRFSTWLYRILVNTASSSRRRLKHRFVRLINSEGRDYDETLGAQGYELYCNDHISDDQNASNPRGIGQDPERELLNAELSQAINRALASLSDNERIAFVLCHQQEIKIIDAAEVMSCSDGSVKSYLFRARAKMRKQLHDFVR